MAQHAPAPHDVDPKAVASAQYFWQRFSKLSMYSALGVVVILVLLALFIA